jgi:hypothetical protein
MQYEVLKAVLVKIQCFKNVYAVRLVNSYRRFGNTALLPNVNNPLPIGMVQFHIIFKYSIPTLFHRTLYFIYVL